MASASGSEASRRRPRVVLVTGAPGSGKTTLGTELSRALQIPFLARDDVRRGAFFTNGAWTERPGPVPTREEAADAFLRILETTAGLGVSSIVEYVVPRQRPADLRRIAAAGDAVVLLTECRDPLRRVARRDRHDRLLNRQPVLDLLGYPTIEDHLGHALARMDTVAHQMRTDFDLPVLHVRTDGPYDPSLDTIVDFAIAGTGPGG